MRLLSPSTTLTLTSTVSPGPKSGISLPAESFSTCSFSSVWIRFMGNSPSAAPATGARCLSGLNGLASFYDKAQRLSPSAFGLGLGLLSGQIGLPEVRAPLPGPPLSLRPPPLGDLGVVAGQQHLRDRLPPPDRRPSVLRVFQQAVGEAFLGGRGLLAHDARQQPDAGVEHAKRRDFPAGEHEIAERDFLQGARRDQPLVDALEAGADDHNALARGQLSCPLLREWRAARAHQQARTLIVGDSIERAGEHVRLHHHAGPTAGRRVVDGAMLVGGVRADVAGVERPEAGIERLTGEA